MTPTQRIKHITKWIKQYATKNQISTLVVGISGGIDSSVVSALCAETGLKTIVVQMPIRQNKKLDNRSSMQAGWLLERYPNVTHMAMDLTPVFTAFEKKVDPFCNIEDDTYETYKLASANSRARLRMICIKQHLGMLLQRATGHIRTLHERLGDTANRSQRLTQLIMKLKCQCRTFFFNACMQLLGKFPLCIQPGLRFSAGLSHLNIVLDRLCHAIEGTAHLPCLLARQGRQTHLMITTLDLAQTAIDFFQRRDPQTD